MDSGAAAAGAAAIAIARAVKASGVIVRVGGQDFLTIIERADSPLVVYSKGGFLSRNHQYLTSYKGLAFFTKSSQLLPLPAKAELVTADRIWIPG
jgi:hypothetical protein